ncbi:MAG: topoisomerase C-terminal repeat-containing protein [Deltaproteobacteria bacterium]|nr:topoisomerase C-terminal repeat-containing protein [Deltaproteobacteria bacterium]
MSKDLVITEKPSVARDIVAAIGGFEERDGYWESEEFLVTFAVGHLYELKEPEELDPKYKRWTLDSLPILPERFEFRAKSQQKDRLKTINELLGRPEVSGVVNACDAGREGELIFREIVDTWALDGTTEAAPKKRNGHVAKALPIRRLWLQSMTREAIREGFRTLRDGQAYVGLGAAAYCRTFSDWLIGMNASRALTCRLRRGPTPQAWSAGRVQTPTLAMLVHREFEVLSHRPDPFWRIQATFLHDDLSYKGTWFDPEWKSSDEDEGSRADRIFAVEKAKAILVEVEGKQAIAAETRKPSKETAPPLFDLTSLQREANRRFGWSASRTLQAAQRNYETHKTLTYPRTDAKALPKDYEAVVGEVLPKLEVDPRFKGASQFLQANGLMNKERTFDDTKVSDHFAIIPTGVVPEALTGDDGRLFELVVRRFLATFHPPAIWSRVERTTKVEAHTFRSRAKILEEPGWRSVLGETEGDDGKLPPLVAGQTDVANVSVTPKSYELEEDETRPPPRITEGRLLSLMENAGEQVEDEETASALKDKGIGTPATRAEIIENLIRKEYVIRAGVLRPTAKGIRLIDLLERMRADRIASPRLTGELEQHLLEVERSRRDPESFMGEVREYAKEIVDRTKTFDFDKLFPDANSLGDCPVCKRPVYERYWCYRCLEPVGWREAWREKKKKDRAAKRKKGDNAELAPMPEDCAFRIWKDRAGRYIDRRTAEELVQSGHTGVLEGFVSRRGGSFRFYRGKLKMVDGAVELEGVPENGAGPSEEAIAAPEFEVNEQPLGPCPVCPDGQVVETRGTFTCSNRLQTLRAIGKDETFPLGLKKKEIPADAKTCTFVLPRMVCLREVTRDEATMYVKDGRTELLADFVSKWGKNFSAFLVRKEDGRHSFEFQQRRGPPKEGAAENGAPIEATDEASPATKSRKKATRKAKPVRAKLPKKEAAKEPPPTKAKKPRAAKKAKIKRKAAPKKKKAAADKVDEEKQTPAEEAPAAP